MGSAEPPAQALRPRVDQIDNVPALNAGRKRKKIDAMQVTETLAEGLKHEFQISVPASDLDAKADVRLVELKYKVRLNGFRPGKVPVSHLKKVYGRSVMAETIDQTIRDTNSQIFTERGFRLATEPKITMPTEQKAVEDILTGKSDLTYTVSIEVVPTIQLADFKSFSVEKPVAEVTDADVDEAIKRIADQNRAFAAKGEGAKTLGLESLDKLKEAARERLAAEFAGATRQRVKRMLLDRLDETHRFEAPPSLVEEEFNLMWNSIKAEMESSGKTFADEDTTEEVAKEEYRRIADRRVRLGLVLSEIGEKNKITVTDDEVSRAVIDRARQMPGREKEVWDYYRNNANALAQLRAPIYEDKVVDFILELANVTEKKVSREDLFKDDDAEKTAA